MLKQKPLPSHCKLCNQPVINKIYTSTISGTPICISTCPDKHLTESHVVIEEVCPYCELKPHTICNCIKKSKTCINNHSWMICNLCNEVTKSINYQHIKRCDYCDN